MNVLLCGGAAIVTTHQNGYTTPLISLSIGYVKPIFGHKHDMLTATQCKMARMATDWGVRELAVAAAVSANTISRFENGGKANVSTLKLIRQAFEAAGV